MKRLFLTVAALTFASCGDYVKYDADAAAGNGTAEPVAAVGADGLNDDAREQIGAATHLDHAALDGILTRYSRDEGGQVYFDYAALDAGTDGVAVLNQYLAVLAAADPEKLTGHDEKLAFWLNAYNAGIIKGVLDAWGGDRGYSVANNDFGLFKTEFLNLGGVTMSPDQLEHVVIRGRTDHDAYAAASNELKARLFALHEDLWGSDDIDPRIHMGVNCASIGCPNLRSTAPYAFQAESLDTQLDEQAASYCQNANKGAGPDGISQLFDWFRDDFSAAGGVDAFIKAHRDNGLSGVDTSRYVTYDWTLNIAPNN